MKNYRHGDVALIGVDKLPLTVIEETLTRVFLKGKNNSHSIDNGKIYIIRNPDTLSEDDFLYGYIEAKNTKLIHSEHSLDGVHIEDGFYELYKQKEETPEGFKIVLD